MREKVIFRADMMAAVWPFVKGLLVAVLLVGMAGNALAAPFLISISNPPRSVNLNAAGQSQLWPNAGILDDGSNTPISLRATILSISAGDRVSLFTSGDNPVVRANTGTFAAEILWEVFNRNTGLPINGDPAFLITDIDGRRGNPIESVSAQCRGLTSYTVNGDFVPGVNANNSGLAQTNIRITETDGTILAEGTQGQNGNQQEGYMQYNWTGVSNWTVSYFATTGGRWYVHDADADIPFDATQTFIDLVDLATIKEVAPGSLTAPEPGQQITFQIRLSNAGPATATGANITDILPAGLTLISATSPNGTVVLSNGNKQIDWSGVDIPVGVERTLTIIAQVDNDPLLIGTTLTNTTNTAFADQTKCSSRDILTSSFIVSAPPAPELSVAKSVSSATAFDGAGDTITYQYIVTNDGNVEIDDVVPVDDRPTFNGVNGSNSIVGFSPAERDDLLPGQSQTFTATYLLSQTDVDNLALAANPLAGIANTASATGTPSAGTLVVNSGSATSGFAISPSVTIAKSVDAISTSAGQVGITDVGDTITYEFVITNTGNVTIDNARPEDQGPNVNGNGRSGAFSSFTPNNASIAPGDSQTYTATFTLAQNDIDNMARAADPLTAIDNQARALGDPRGPLALPNTVSNLVETGFAPTPNMTIVKSVDALPANPGVGTNIVYRWVVENTGNVSFSNVTVTDTGPTFDGQAAAGTLSGISPSNANLAPGQTQNFSANYILRQDDVDNISVAANPATAIDNSSILNGTPAGGTFATLTSNTVETGFAVTGELTITKSVTGPTTGLGSSASLTDPGDTLSYTFDVQNTGSVTVDNIVVSDAGPEFNSIAGAGSFSAITCPLSSLLPNQTTSCSASYTLAQADIDNAVAGGVNSVVNSATVAATDPSGGATPASNTSNAQATIAPNSQIAITKTGAAPTVNLGADTTITDPDDTIAYQLLVENTGNTTLGSVDVSDSLAMVTCPALTINGAAFSNGVSSLVPGDGVACTASYIITQPDINTGQVVNTASVTAVDPDPLNANVTDSDMAITGFTQRSAIALVKTAGTPTILLGLDNTITDADDTVTYSYTLRNTGNVSLNNVSVSDPLITDPPNSETIACDIAAPVTLAAGEVLNCTGLYTFIQADIDAGEVNNTGSGTGTPPPGLTVPTSVASALVTADQDTSIALDKVAGVPTTNLGALNTVVDELDTVLYTFTVTNTGNVTLTNVILTDPGIIAAAGNQVSCPLSILMPGMAMMCNASYVLTQTDIDAGEFNNSATVTGTPPAPPPLGLPLSPPTATSGAMVALPPSPSLSVAKSASAVLSSIVASDTITYTYLVTNTGNVTINGVVPVDAGPSFNGVAGTNSLGAFTPAPVSLAPGANQSFSADYVVSQADLDNMAAAADPSTAIDNTATASGTPVGGTLAIVAPSTVETGVAPTPLLTLTKSSIAPTPIAPATSIAVGQSISYDFSLLNAGNVSISNPSIEDAQCQPTTVLAVEDSGDTNTNDILDVGEAWLFSCSYAITQADLNAGTVQNTATATGQDPAGNDVVDVSDSTNPADTGAGDSDPTNTPLAQAAAWSIVKSTASTPTAAGQTLDYRFTLTNDGNVSISNVGLSDPKCAASPLLLSGDADGNALFTPNETWVYSCTSIPVTQAEVDAAQVDNQVDATGTAAAGVLPAINDSISTPIAKNPSLAIIKTVGFGGLPTAAFGQNTAAIDADDRIFYIYDVTNNGNVTLDTITINDAGPTFGAAAGSGIFSGGINCGTPAPVLAPNDSVSCTGVYVLRQSDVDAGIAGGADSVINSATASGADTITSASVTSPSSSANTTIASAAEIDVIKSASNVGMTGPMGETIVSDVISYEITATNIGNARLSNVLVADNLAGVVVTCPALSNGAPTPAPFTNGTGSLAVGDSVTCTATYSITQTDLNSGRVINTATAAGDDPAADRVSASSELTTPLTQATSILLNKSASLPSNGGAGPTVGQTITYTFTLENTGNVTLTSPQVSDPNCGPTPLTQAGGSFNVGDLNTNSELDAGEIWTFSCGYITTIDDFNAGAVVNVAVGTGTPPADSGLPNPSSTAGAQADLQQSSALSLIKSGGAPTIAGGALATATDVGDTIEYTFEIENTGNVTLSDISITDPLITDAPNNGNFSCEIIDIPLTVPPTSTPAALPFDLDTARRAICTASYSLTQADVDAGTVMNEASATGTPPPTIPPAPAPVAISSAMVGITPVPTLSIDKTVDPVNPNIRAGDDISYNFVVTNTGNVTIDNVAPIDSGPTFNGFVGTGSISVFSPTGATILPGDNQTFTATYTVSQVDLDNVAAADDKSTPAVNESLDAIDNQATATGEPVNGLLGAVPPDNAETGIGTLPELTLLKTSVAPTPAIVAANIVYTFTLENTGNVTIASPSITDAQCAAPVGSLTFTNGYVSGDSAEVGALDVDEIWIFSCTYPLTQTDIDNSTVQNTATANGTEPGGDPVSDVSDSGNAGDDTGAGNDPTNTALLQTPAWTVVKSTVSVPTQAGDALDYRFVVDNTGNVSISSVVIADSKCTATPTLDSGDSNLNNILTPDEVWIFSCTSIPVTQDEVDAGQVDNTVNVNGVPPIGGIPTASNSISTLIASNPSWTVDKTTSSIPTAAGSTLVYNFELRNTGNVSIGGVSVADAKCNATPTFNGGDSDNDSRIDPNEIWNYSCTSIAVTQPEADAGVVLNNVIVSGSPPTGSVPNATDSLATTLVPSPSLILDKTASVPSEGFGLLSNVTDEGDRITYSFEVENNGNVTIDTISINDLGQTFNGVTGTGTLSTITCPLTVLMPSQTTICSATYTLTQADIDNAIAGGVDSASNSATAQGEDPGNTVATSPGSTALTSIPVASSIEIVKTAGTPSIAGGSDPLLTDPGDTISYTLDIENNGNSTLSAVNVSDNLTSVDCLPFVLGADSLAPGASFSCTAVYSITQLDLNAGQVINTASATGTDPAGSSIFDDDQATVGFTQKSSLVLTKTGTTLPAVPSVGDGITYTFAVENTGNVALSSPQVTDPLCQNPVGPLTAANGYVSGDPDIDAAVTPAEIATAVANAELDSAETWIFSCIYNITAADIANGEIANTATATGTPPAGLPVPSSTSGTLIDAEQVFGIAVDKVAGLPTVSAGVLGTAVDVGDTVAYRINVQNTGNTVLESIVVTDPLITDAPNNGTISCPFSTLNPSLVTAPVLPVDPTEMDCIATYTITQADLDAGTLSNTASATGLPVVSGPLTPISPSASSGAIVSLPPMPSLAVVKSASAIASGVNASDIITYSYEITNSGNVTINDVLPVDSGPTFNGAAADNALGAFTVALPATLPVSLAPGASQVFSAEYSLSQGDIDNMAAASNPNTAVDNSATATGTPTSGTLATVTPSTVETGVAGSPGLELVKTSVAPTPAAVGSTIDYSFSLQNTGNVSISSPTITDAQCQSPGNVLSFGSGFDSGDAGQVGVLDVGEIWLFSCSYALTQDDIDAGTVQNTADALGQNPAGGDVIDTSDSNNAGDDSGGSSDPTNTPLLQTPGWTVAKSTSSVPTAAGNTLVYNFILGNTGNVSVSNVVVSDAKCASAPVLNSGDIDNNDILAPTEVWNYSCTSIGVTQTEVDTGSVDNAVSVTGTPSGGGPLAPATDAISTPISSAASLTLTKSAAAPTVGAGIDGSATDANDTIAYTFEVQNNGNVTVDGIVVNDLGVSFDSNPGTGSLSAINCPVTVLAPGQSTSCTALYTLTQDDVDNAVAGGTNSIANSATVSGDDPSDVSLTSVASNATTTISPDSEIQIVKTAMPPTVSGGVDSSITDPGDTISYNLAIENTGNTTLTNITVSDSLSAVDCLPFVNGAGSLAPGATLNCSAQVVLDQDDLNASGITNTASVSAFDPSGASVSDDDTITSGLTQKTSIVLTKAASVLLSTPPVVGEPVSYSFSLRNTGNVSLANPNVDDPRCGGVLTAGSGFDGGDVNGNLELDAGEVWLFSCDYLIVQADVDAGGVANTAVGTGTPPASSGLPDPSSTASSLADIQQETGISLDKTSGLPTIANGTINDASDVGDSILYTFNVANSGNVTLTDVAITDPRITAPISCANTTLVSVAAATAATPATTTCTATYVLTQADIDAGEVMNSATITATPPVTVPPSTPPTSTSSNTVPVVPAPRLSVLKSASTIAASVVAGDMIIYSYVVENIGNVTIDSVLPVDAGPTFNSVAGTNALGAFTVAAPAALPISLAPGDTQLFTAEYTLSQADLDNMAAAPAPTTAIDNTATATGVAVNGTLETVTPSTVETGVAASPALTLLKSSSAPASSQPGSLISYNFLLSNTGNVTISNPVVNDAQCQSPGAVLSFASGFVSGDAGQAGLLDVGETWEFACSYPITQADIDAGTVQNTASAVGQDPAGNDTSDTSDSTNAADVPGAGDSDPTNTSLSRNPAWTVTKSTVSVPAAVGDTLDYTFVVDNTGNVSIASVAVADAKCAAAPTLDSGDADNNLILAPNEIWTFSCTSIGVTLPEADAGVVNNSVSVTGTPPSGTSLPPATSSLATPLLAAPSLAVTKSAGVPTVGLGAITTATDAGDTISYSFVVTNDGNVTIDSVAIDDDGQLFNGLPGTGTLGPITCPLTTLVPAQSTTCTASYTLTLGDINNAIAGGANSVSNTATATGNPPVGPQVESPESTATTSIVSMAALDIVKTAGTPTINLGPNNTITDPGDTISYSLVITNTGNTTVSAVNVNDTIAAVDCLPFVVGVDSLDPADTLSCTAIYTLDQDDLNNGTIVNQATVSGNDPFNMPVSATDQITTGLTQNTSVVLSKQLSAASIVDLQDVVTPPVGGDIIEYEFALSNTGNVSLTAPTVTDPRCLNSPLSFGNGFVSGDSNLNAVFDAGEIWNFSCNSVVTQPEIDGALVINQAVGAGVTPPSSDLPNPSSTAGSTFTNVSQLSGISLRKIAALPTIINGGVATATDALPIADTILYSFTIENTGSVTLNNVVVTDPTITGSAVTPIASCTTATLAPAATINCSASYSVTQANVDAGFVMNSASVTGTPPVNVPAPVGSSSAMVGITPAPTLTVDKTVIAPLLTSPVVVGDEITYQYVVTNTGNVTINDVSPIDAGPTISGIAATNTLSSFDIAPVSLTPGASQTFTATYALSQTDIDNIAAAPIPASAVANSATASGAPVLGTLAAVTPDSATTGVIASPSLDLRKTSVAPATVIAGAEIIYNFTLNNDGNVTIRNPIVNDPLCQIPGNTLSFASGYVSGDTGVIAQSLDVGETWNFSCRYAITQADIDAGVRSNQANASGQEPGGSTITDNSDNPAGPNDGTPDPTLTPLAPAPAWNVSKSTASLPQALGDTLDYVFDITNTGNVSINLPSVVVLDAKCAAPGPVLVAGSDLGADNLISPAGLNGVPAAETVTYTCTSIGVTQGELDANAVINTVNITGTPVAGVLAGTSDTISSPVSQMPLMSLAKSAGATTLNNDGSFDQVFDFELRNVGNVTLSAVSIVDDLNAQFGACFDSIVSAGAATFIDVVPANDSINAAIGTFPSIATAATLAIGDSLSLTGLSARFNPNALGCTFPDPAQNSATAQASSPAGPISDGSDSVADPAVGLPNNPGTPTVFTPPVTAPELGVAKDAALLAFNFDFSFDVEYTILIQNTGDVDLTNLDLFDDIASQFGAAFVPSPASDLTSGVISAPVVSLVTDASPTDTVLPTVDPQFRGDSGNVFDGTSGHLGVGDVIQVVFSIKANPTLLAVLPTQFDNVANAGAEAPNGDNISDLSNSGSDPTAGSGGPSDPTVVTLDDVANLPIVLGQFSSRVVAANTIKVEWQTQTEVANLGFNIYGRVGEEWQRLNAEIIAGQGDSVEIVSYSITLQSDVTAISLSDIDGRGEETLHGPFVVGKTYGATPQRKTTDWSGAKQLRKDKQQLRNERRRQNMLRRNRLRQQGLREQSSQQQPLKAVGG